jgi:hypothetical protein
VNFDPSATYECAVRIAARVSPKDIANDCQHFSGRTTFERETTAASSQTAIPRNRAARRKPSTTSSNSEDPRSRDPVEILVMGFCRRKTKHAQAHLSDHASVQLVLFTQTFGGSESGDVAKQILTRSRRSTTR